MLGVESWMLVETWVRALGLEGREWFRASSFPKWEVESVWFTLGEWDHVSLVSLKVCQMGPTDCCNSRNFWLVKKCFGGEAD